MVSGYRGWAFPKAGVSNVHSVPSRKHTPKYSVVPVTTKWGQYFPLTRLGGIFRLPLQKMTSTWSTARFSSVPIMLYHSFGQSLYSRLIPKPLSGVFVNCNAFFHLHFFTANTEVVPQNALQFRVFHLAGPFSPMIDLIAWTRHTSAHFPQFVHFS